MTSDQLNVDILVIDSPYRLDRNPAGVVRRRGSDRVAVGEAHLDPQPAIGR
jgi:hypothetical protein